MAAGQKESALAGEALEVLYRGDLYISNFGFGFPPGAGQILRVELPHADGDDD